MVFSAFSSFESVIPNPHAIVMLMSHDDGKISD